MRGGDWREGYETERGEEPTPKKEGEKRKEKKRKERKGKERKREANERANERTLARLELKLFCRRCVSLLLRKGTWCLLGLDLDCVVLCASSQFKSSQVEAIDRDATISDQRERR